MEEELLYRISLFLEAEISYSPLQNLNRDILDRLPSLWRERIESHSSIASMIKTIWAPAEKLVPPDFIDGIIGKCSDLIILSPSSRNLKPFLCYLFSAENKDDVSAWAAGQPVSEDESSRFSNMSPSLPLSYKIFTKIHNGFSIEGNGGDGLWPLSKVTLLSNIYQEEDLKGIRSSEIPSKLLAFSSYLDGDIQCYNYGLAFDGDYKTVRWDHEGLEIYNPESFWSFLVSFVTNRMGVHFR